MIEKMPTSYLDFVQLTMCQQARSAHDRGSGLMKCFLRPGDKTENAYADRIDIWVESNWHWIRSEVNILYLHDDPFIEILGFRWALERPKIYSLVNADPKFSRTRHGWKVIG